MTEKELRKLNRKDLLQMLIEQSQEVQNLRKKLAEAEMALENKTIAIDKAGSIAEASLQLSGIFQATQDACQQYLDNVSQLCQRQEANCTRMEAESQAKAKSVIEEAEKQIADMERDTNDIPTSPGPSTPPNNARSTNSGKSNPSTDRTALVASAVFALCGTAAHCDWSNSTGRYCG